MARDPVRLPISKYLKLSEFKRAIIVGASQIRHSISEIRFNDCYSLKTNFTLEYIIKLV